MRAARAKGVRTVRTIRSQLPYASWISQARTMAVFEAEYSLRPCQSALMWLSCDCGSAALPGESFYHHRTVRNDRHCHLLETLVNSTFLRHDGWGRLRSQLDCDRDILWLSRLPKDRLSISSLLKWGDVRMEKAPVIRMKTMPCMKADQASGKLTR